MSDRHFNFNRALVRCPDQDDRVHVIKALLNMRERDDLKSDTIPVVMKTIEYIKELESEVRRLSSTRSQTLTANVTIEGATDSQVIAEYFRREVARIIRPGKVEELIGGGKGWEDETIVAGPSHPLWLIGSGSNDEDKSTPSDKPRGLIGRLFGGAT